MLAPATHAGQQSPARAIEDADARCLGVFSILAGGTDKTNQESGKVGAVYFAGKLRGRNPAIDFETALRRILPALEANIASENQRCFAELRDAGAAMTAAGNALQKTGN